VDYRGLAHELKVALAREIDSKPKYVVTRRPMESQWAKTVFLSGDISQEIRALKRREAGELVLSGSPSRHGGGTGVRCPRWCARW